MVSPYGSSAGAQPATGMFQIWVSIFPKFTATGLYFGLMSSSWAYFLNYNWYDLDTIVSTSIKILVIQALT